MTAERLQSLFAATATEDDRFEGGSGPWRVESRFGVIYLTVSEASGDTCFTSVLRLDDALLGDLELALSRARVARDNYRANLESGQ